MIHGYAADDIRLLATRRKLVLARLSLLTEAPAALAFEQRDGSGQGHGGSSKPPPETSFRRIESNADRPPSRDFSLYEHYKWRFERAGGDLRKTETLCALAERDYWDRVLTGGRGRRTKAEDKADRNRRIVAEYEGVAAIEVAVFERMSISSIRAVRKEFGRDPGSGQRCAA